MAFEKVILASGEPRADYIQRRLGEGADNATVLAEINGPDLYSGALGETWPAGVVYAEKSKLAPKPKPKFDVEKLVGEAHPKREIAFARDEVDPVGVVPAEYEGILDAEDVAEVRKQAAEDVRKEQRKVARAALLKQAKEDLAREARIAQRLGAARGDLVDVNIDLAAYADKLVLDGEVYLHGQTYRVPRGVASVLMEQIQRSWNHQETISGQRQDMNRQRKAMSTPGGRFIDGVRV